VTPATSDKIVNTAEKRYSVEAKLPVSNITKKNKKYSCQ